MTTRSGGGRFHFSGIGALFVLLWSTGFIGAKLGLPYAEPLTFLCLRMGLVTVLLGATALGTGAPWPRTRREFAHVAIAGLLVHGGYLSGVFSAIHHGLSAGVAALIVGLQPLLTAFSAAIFLHEKPTRLQWAGLVLGLLGNESKFLAFVVDAGEREISEADASQQRGRRR